MHKGATEANQCDYLGTDQVSNTLMVTTNKSVDLEHKVGTQSDTGNTTNPKHLRTNFTIINIRTSNCILYECSESKSTTITACQSTNVYYTNSILSLYF